MERMIHRHMVPLFAGQVPTTPQFIESTFALRIGIAGRTANSLKRFQDKQPFRIKSAPLVETLSRAMNEQETPERSLYSLEQTMQDDLSAVKDTSSTLSKRRAQRKQLTPLQFLQQLRDYLPTALPSINIDYITLTKMSNDLMRRVRTELSRKVEVQYPDVRLAGDSNDFGPILTVQGILHENLQYAKLYEQSRRKEPYQGGPQLNVAAGVFKAFRTKHKHAFQQVSGPVQGVRQES